MPAIEGGHATAQRKHVEKLMRSAHRVVGWGGNGFAMMSLVLLVLWITGWVMYCLPADTLAEMSQFQETLRRSSGILHGVLSWFLCVLLGRTVWPHVGALWYQRKHRSQWLWGLINLQLLGFLSAGGLLLMYGNASVHDGMSPWHFGAGAILPVCFVAHAARRFVR